MFRYTAGRGNMDTWCITTRWIQVGGFFFWVFVQFFGVMINVEIPKDWFFGVMINIEIAKGYFYLK